MTVRCLREPVAITNFAAAHTYWLPGDAGYRRRDLFQSYVCSEATARGRGYVRSQPVMARYVAAILSGSRGSGDAP